MAALVVVNVSEADGHQGAGARMGIFPGGATPAVYPADMPFWIAYGFAPELGDPAENAQELGDDTRFELDVDGVSMGMRTSLQIQGEIPRRKTDLADFPSGLPAGWHEFVGRWYDRGQLILSSRASIQFVER